MSVLQKIPLTPDTTDQYLTVELGGNPYVLRVLWNERYQYFALSIFEADNNPILLNIKMVKNYPLTARFQDLRLPYGDIYFVQERGTVEYPNYADLAVNANLYYYEPDTVPAAQIVRGQ